MQRGSARRDVYEAQLRDLTGAERRRKRRSSQVLSFSPGRGPSPQKERGVNRDVMSPRESPKRHVQVRPGRQRGPFLGCLGKVGCGSR